VTAGKLQAGFDDLGQLASVHARRTPTSCRKCQAARSRQPSDTLDASFHPGSGIDSLMQQGSVAYADGERKAWGNRATYTPATRCSY